MAYESPLLTCGNETMHEELGWMIRGYKSRCIRVSDMLLHCMRKKWKRTQQL